MRFEAVLICLLIMNINIACADEYYFNPDNCTDISAAIDNVSSNSTVYLAAGIYPIHDSIIPLSDVSIIGENVTNVTLYTDDFKDVSYSSNPAMIYVNHVKNITVENVTFLGPAINKTHQHDNSGTTRIGGLREARNGIKMYQSDNLTVRNCNFTMLLSDGIRVSRSTNIQSYKNKFISAGHDSISLYRSSNFTSIDNYYELFINTCIRFYHIKNAIVENCTFIQNLSGTGAGYLEMQAYSDNITISNNTFLHSADPSIFYVGYEGQNLKIIGNEFNNCKPIPGNIEINISG